MGGAAGYSVLPSVNCPVGAIIITVVVISNSMAIAASGLGSSKISFFIFQTLVGTATSATHAMSRGRS